MDRSRASEKYVDICGSDKGTQRVSSFGNGNNKVRCHAVLAWVHTTVFSETLRLSQPNIGNCRLSKDKLLFGFQQ